jgi:hypothetical protein
MIGLLCFVLAVLASPARHGLMKFPRFAEIGRPERRPFPGSVLFF